MNQKMKDAHNEVISMSDHSIQQLIDNVRTKIQPLFKISEGIAMLDMLSCFAQLVTTNEYVRPEITDDKDGGTLAIKAGRHPIAEKILRSSSSDHPTSTADPFVPNDVFATPQTRFQIITGCNMSGKSTYIRSIALTAVMAQTGCFVPATYASVPIIHNLFARVSTDDSTEATVSTFAAEMREIAFILRNLTSGENTTSQSLVLVDELGRGTSTTDGLAIAIAIAEALIESRAFVWFVTHFRDLPRILAERAGVVNLHLTVDIGSDNDDHPSPSPSNNTHPEYDILKMRMRYRIADGPSSSRFYGLALARVASLPEPLITTATQVSQRLHERNEARKHNPRATAVLRRRKLVLSLREQLCQARANGAGRPAGELRAWLERLQGEFLIRMRAINTETEEAALGDEEIEGTEMGIGFDQEGGGEEVDGVSSAGVVGDADFDSQTVSASDCGDYDELYEMNGARGDSLLQE